MTQIQANSIILSIVTFYITASRSLPVAIPAFRCCLEMLCKDSIIFYDLLFKSSAFYTPMA